MFNLRVTVSLFYHSIRHHSVGWFLLVYWESISTVVSTNKTLKLFVVKKHETNLKKPKETNFYWGRYPFRICMLLCELINFQLLTVIFIAASKPNFIHHMHAILNLINWQKIICVCNWTEQIRQWSTTCFWFLDFNLIMGTLA